MFKFVTLLICERIRRHEPIKFNVMKNLSVFIVTFGTLTKEQDNKMELAVGHAMENNFSDSDYQNTVMDEDNRTMICFFSPEDKHKVDAVVEAANAIIPGIITRNEDVTDKFVLENDFDCDTAKANSKEKEELIALVSNYIQDNLNIDQVFDKMKKIGAENLLEGDKAVIEGWAA